MSENDETVALQDETQEEEIFIEEEADAESDDKDWKAEALKLQAILNRKTKKAAEAPAPQPQEPDTQINQSDYLTRDEGLLIAQGLDEEALAQLHIISKGKGISLIEAKADPLFEAYDKAQKEEKRRADAKLGTSNSSGRTPKGKPVEEMTREEHEAYWRDKNGL